MQLSGSTPFAIADYGAADGGTSIDMMRKAVARIRQAAPRSADHHHLYRSAAQRFLGAVPAAARTAAGHTENPLGAAAECLHLRQRHELLSADISGLRRSRSASRRRRCTGSASCRCRSPTIRMRSAPTRRRRRCSAAAALADWDTILLHRARELAPGGKFVLVNFCEDEQGHYLGHTGGVNMHDTFAKHWRNLLQDGTISEAEYRRANFVQFYKTKEDFTAPLRRSRFRRAARPASFSKKPSRARPDVPTRPNSSARAIRPRFAKSYIPTLRSWSESTFMGGLDPSRPAAGAHGDHQSLLRCLRSRSGRPHQRGTPWITFIASWSLARRSLMLQRSRKRRKS